MGDDSFMLGLMVEWKDDAWRWRWYDDDTGKVFADGAESTDTAAYRSATTYLMERTDGLARTLASEIAAVNANADAAKKRAAAAEREVSQLRADRAVLAAVVLSLLGAQARHIVPADPMPLLMALRAQTLTLLGSHDNVDTTNYLREMFERLDAEAGGGHGA